MTITVVMATRNAGRFVAEALASIHAQQVSGLRVVVVDAASTDTTAATVATFPHTRLEQQTGAGLWQAWNQAIAAADSDFIAMLDSDDRWEPGSVAAHLAAFAAMRQAQVSIGRTRFFLDSGALPAGVRPQLLRGTHRGGVPGATMCRREVFDRMGLFPVDLPTAADIEWFARLRQSGVPVAEPDAVVLAKRIHPDNLGGQFERDDQYDRDLLRVAREALQRRRAAEPA